MATELPDALDRLDAAADALLDTPLGQMDVAALARWSVHFETPEVEVPVVPLLAGQTVAVARDAAFCFIYAANLDTLCALGAGLVFFSPLAGEPVPVCDAVWLPGGYPELHAQTLSACHDDLTVYDVALLGRLPHQAWLAPPSPADHATVERALCQTQARDWQCRPLGALSGGERQRLRPARLLAVEADEMLMDEPLANLDPPHQADWIALVRSLVAHGKTVVSVLHEITLALMANEVGVMQQDRIAHAGPTHQSAAHRGLEAAFEHRIEVHPLRQQRVALPRSLSDLLVFSTALLTTHPTQGVTTCTLNPDWSTPPRFS
ncbi:ABC transporter ATP-binding protein [Hydrogenophaga sp.]|uniref:ABC transporter ATP-binding protein n=1 Tax=Hydrogenophaga sp. TaxID=1904254 RepID=UPI002731FE8E|nr:ATP-binding cassette domain-containing protein [Hydrogenophaga sp.]MDP2015694.1 ABC transporter ATP-binding protein [Hydrogenophaga sp.]MDP3164770.1 ABC transporter ATP-binding protein [Hydrogenophaga sp.]